MGLVASAVEGQFLVLLDPDDVETRFGEQGIDEALLGTATRPVGIHIRGDAPGVVTGCYLMTLPFSKRLPEGSTSQIPTVPEPPCSMMDSDLIFTSKFPNSLGKAS